MGFFDWLRGGQDQAQTLSGEAQMIGVQRLASKPSADLDSLISAHDRNEIIFACIKVRSDAAMDPSLTVEKKTKAGWETQEDHPLSLLLSRPNPKMDGAAFMRAAFVSMDIAGKFYAEKVRSKGGLLVELWPLDPSRVKPRYRRLSNGAKEITHYEYKDGSFTKHIPPDDMLVRDKWGLGKQAPSPLSVAMGNVDIDNAQTDYVRAFFDNAGVPSGILKVKGVLSEQKSRHIKNQWRAKYGRQWGNQHNIAVLDNNADYQQIGTNIKDLNSETMRNISETRICMVFGVPPLIIYTYAGLLRATYSNLKEAWEGFWNATMSPELKGWRSFFALALLPEFEDAYTLDLGLIRLSWDLSQVAALQKDVNQSFDRAHKAFLAGGLTLNEYRLATGWPAYEDEEIGKLNPYLLKLLRDSKATAAKPEEDEAEDGEAEDGDDEGEKVLRAKPTEHKGTIELSLIEGKTKTEVSGYLQAQYKVVADKIRESV